MFKLTKSSNKEIYNRFEGKNLVRTAHNTFLTEDGTDGFRVSNIAEETFRGDTITIYTQNSVYVFATA